MLARAFIIRKSNDTKIKKIFRNRKKYLQKLVGAKPLKICGSVFIKDESDFIFLYRKLDILALRGKYTKKILEKKFGYDLSNIALGDPGLLMNRLIKPTTSKKYELGVIPHYVDANNKIIDLLVEQNDRIVNI